MKELVIPDELKEVQGCVYKILYDGRYIIVMAKTLARSLTSIINDLNRFRKGVREGKSESNLYLRFYYYIILNPDGEFDIKMVLKSESEYELLKHCQIELAKGIDDERCLNSKHTPYINKNIQSNRKETKDGKPVRKGHVNRGVVLNFLRWKKLNYPALAELSE